METNDEALVMPGDRAQLFRPMPEGGVVRGFTPSEGVVRKLFVGPHVVDFEAGEKIPPEGLAVTPGPMTIATVLVENVKPTPTVVSGEWAIEKLGAKETPQAPKVEALRYVGPAIPASVVELRPVAAPAPPPTATVAVNLASTKEVQENWKKLEALAAEMVRLGERVNAGVGGARVLAPGANEVAVLLQRNEALKIVDMIKTSRPLEDFEKWGIVRKIEDAIFKK